MGIQLQAWEIRNTPAALEVRQLAAARAVAAERLAQSVLTEQGERVAV